jgi:hypothetical protein
MLSADQMSSNNDYLIWKSEIVDIRLKASNFSVTVVTGFLIQLAGLRHFAKHAKSEIPTMSKPKLFLVRPDSQIQAVTQKPVSRCADCGARFNPPTQYDLWCDNRCRVKFQWNGPCARQRWKGLRVV